MPYSNCLAHPLKHLGLLVVNGGDSRLACRTLAGDNSSHQEYPYLHYHVNATNRIVNIPVIRNRKLKLASPVRRRAKPGLRTCGGGSKLINKPEVNLPLAERRSFFHSVFGLQYAQWRGEP